LNAYYFKVWRKQEIEDE